MINHDIHELSIVKKVAKKVSLSSGRCNTKRSPGHQVVHTFDFGGEEAAGFAEEKVTRLEVCYQRAMCFVVIIIRKHGRRDSTARCVLERNALGRSNAV